MSTTPLLLVWGLIPALALPLLLALRRSCVPGVNAFAASNVLMMMALLVHIVEPWVPTTVYNIASQLAALAALALLYRGIRQFFALPGGGRRAALVSAAGLAAAGVLIQFTGDAAYRVALASGLGCVGAALVALTIVRMRARIDSGLALAYAAAPAFILAATYAARVVLYGGGFVQPQTPAEPSTAGLVWIVIGCMVVPALYLGMALLVQARLTQRLQTALTFDALTGAYSRRSILRSLEEEVARSARTGRPFSLMLLDVDHFKAINDQYGHPVGDAVLQSLGQVVRDAVRGSDRFGRIGGEEFALLMYDAGLAPALRQAERVRLALRHSPLRLGSGKQLSYTVSGGLACWGPGDTAASLMARADEALYRAKRLGRDRVEKTFAVA